MNKHDNCDLCDKKATQRLRCRTTLIEDRKSHLAGDVWHNRSMIDLCDDHSTELFKKVDIYLEMIPPSN